MLVETFSRSYNSDGLRERGCLTSREVRARAPLFSEVAFCPAAIMGDFPGESRGISPDRVLADPVFECISFTTVRWVNVIASQIVERG